MMCLAYRSRAVASREQNDRDEQQQLAGAHVHCYCPEAALGAAGAAILETIVPSVFAPPRALN
jgi:hypothetical protein